MFMKQTTRHGIVKTKTNKTGDLIIAFLCLIPLLACLLPMLNVLSTSLSSQLAVTNRHVYFWPVDLDLQPYKSVLGDRGMQTALITTIMATVISTVFCMVMTTLCAYPLSQKTFIGRTFFNTLIILTMYFSAGLIPEYLNIKRLGLINNFWVLILPGAISVFNMIVLKSFFYNIPTSLKESAELDGANHWTILTRIFVPLSTPVLATLTLFYAVGRWNGFQDVRFYISDPKLYTIQFRLYQIIKAQASLESSLEGAAIKSATESLRAASIMFATIPILLVYPWLQKYFVSGITLGAVNG